jgi:hypothetical protein
VPSGGVPRFRPVRSARAPSSRPELRGAIVLDSRGDGSHGGAHSIHAASTSPGNAVIQ